MSKRFGRNQRRRAREALAAAASEAERFKTAHAMASGLLEHVAEKKRDLEQEIQEAKSMVGPYSALFGPKTTAQHHQAHPGARFRLPADAGMDSPFTELGDEPTARDVMTVIDLPGMLASVAHDELKCNVHVLVEYDGGRWAYHVDRRTLLAMGKSRAIREISRYLAMEIGAELFGARRVAA